MEEFVISNRYPVTTVSEAAGTVRTGTATDLYQFITCLLNMGFLLTVIPSYDFVQLDMVISSSKKNCYVYNADKIEQLRLEKNGLFNFLRTT